MERRIVCAALRLNDGTVICGARHFDSVMTKIMGALNWAGTTKWRAAEQGFIDQRGVFLTREQAYDLAAAAGQIIRVSGDENCRLFSENLY